jgi:anti-anti-sigma factor
MDVEITSLPTMVVLGVHGEVDLATSPKLHEALDALDPDVGLVVDLSDVSFLDSSGLTELVRAHERHAEAGGVRLVVASKGIRRVLEVSGLTEVFSIYESSDDAIRGS